MSTAELYNLKLSVIKGIVELHDEALLQKMKAILEEAMEFELTEAQKNLLEERKAKYDNGESRTFTWAEVKEKARKSLEL